MRVARAPEPSFKQIYCCGYLKWLLHESLHVVPHVEETVDDFYDLSSHLRLTIAFTDKSTVQYSTDERPILIFYERSEIDN